MTEQEHKAIFRQWLAQYKALIFKIVRAYTRETMDQQDLFQEVALQVWKSVPSFRGESAVTTWIYRIALNTAITWNRKQRRKAELEQSDELRQLIVVHTVEEDPRIQWLYDEIHRLDEIDRSIALLLLEGMSYKEMAAVVGITENHIGVKINRIKKHLISKSKNI